MAAKSTSYQFQGQKGQPYELHMTLSPTKPNSYSTSIKYVVVVSFLEKIIIMLYQNTFLQVG